MLAQDALAGPPLSHLQFISPPTLPTHVRHDVIRAQVYGWPPVCGPIDHLDIGFCLPGSPGGLSDWVLGPQVPAWQRRGRCGLRTPQAIPSPTNAPLTGNSWRDTQLEGEQSRDPTSTRLRLFSGTANQPLAEVRTSLSLGRNTTTILRRLPFLCSGAKSDAPLCG